MSVFTGVCEAIRMPIHSRRNTEEETTRMSCDECMLTMILSAFSPIYQECIELFMAAHANCKNHEEKPDTTRMRKIMKENAGSSFADLARIRVQDPII